MPKMNAVQVTLFISGSLFVFIFLIVQLGRGIKRMLIAKWSLINWYNQYYRKLYWRTPIPWFENTRYYQYRWFIYIAAFFSKKFLDSTFGPEFISYYEKTPYE